METQPIDEKWSTDDWVTPKWLADALGPFDLDPCSNGAAHINCLRRFTVTDDGLTQPWPRLGSIFCNPPYSSVLPWARRLAAHWGPWVALVKLDPTTRWWATLQEAGPKMAAFRKRLRFEGPQTMTANFPSVLVYKDWDPPAALHEYIWLPRRSRQAIPVFIDDAPTQPHIRSRQ